jgi:integrase/recombinase XerD
MPRKKKTPWRKRCHCQDRLSCSHPWWLRLKVKGGSRERVNLTAAYPDNPVEIAALKARKAARNGTATIVSRTVRDVAAVFDSGSYQLKALVDYLGDKAIDTVTTRDIKYARDRWQSRKNAGPNGERHFLAAARAFFNWAVKENYATRTPFLSPQGKALITVSKSSKRTRRLEPGEEERIRAVGDAFVKDFMSAMLLTGCRPGELRTLQRSEVRERIVILASKAKDKEERRIPIRPELKTILDRRTGDYPFGDEQGRMLSRERLCERWRDVCKRANVVNLHLHDLRAEFGSRLCESDVPLHIVRDALGHSNVSMTSTYLRSRTDSLDAAYARLK